MLNPYFTVRDFSKIEDLIEKEEKGQYNFVKPHMAPTRKDTSKCGGIASKGWKELLELATTKSK